MAEIDPVDQRILDLLTANARRSVREIAQDVGLTPAPVKRRIDRMERDGIIAGYTVQPGPAQRAPGIESFTAIRYSGRMNIDDIFEHLSGVPEVIDVYTTTGDSDALVHVRTPDVAQLQSVVQELRRHGDLLSTRTWVVMERRSGPTGRPVPHRTDADASARRPHDG